MSANNPPNSGNDESQAQPWQGGCLWSGIGLIVGSLTLGLLFVIVSLTRVSRIEQAAEPDLTIIVPPTDIPMEQTPTTEMDDPLNGTATPDLSVSELFSEGDLVEVYDTEGQGLSLRNAPGLESVINEYGLENEVFEVFGGPVTADGYTWWYLVNPYDETKQGWGVGRFLRKITP